MQSRPKFQIFVREIGSIERSKPSKSTTSRGVAEKAFGNLINHDDLHGNPVEVLLMHEGVLVARHRCDAKRGDELNWRGRLDEITWPDTKPGRPNEMKGGKRLNVYLDDASLKKAEELGGGNISLGIRMALMRA
jgi:hypothetical protein